MEPKKNPKYDIHRQRGVLLPIGLAVSLTLMIAAFQWKTQLTVAPGGGLFLDDLTQDEILPDVIPVTDQRKMPVVQPKTIRASMATFSPVSIVEVNNNTSVDETPPIFDQNNPIEDINVGVEVPIEVVPTDTFRVVETMPKPIGGWKAFYETLQENIHYPRQAARMGRTGKVFVEFTVNKTGELVNFKILRGVGLGCDEEASRVLALTKWTVGKQRGKPVNVRMVQPIHFSIKEN